MARHSLGRLLFMNYLNDFNVLFPVPPDDSLMCAPEFTKTLKDLTINDGEPLTLTCSIKGDPDPQCEWFKDGKVKIWFFVIGNVQILQGKEFEMNG